MGRDLVVSRYMIHKDIMRVDRLLTRPLGFGVS